MIEQPEPVPASTSQDSEPADQKALRDYFELSGDFRGAILYLKSTVIGNAEVKDIESLAPEPGDPPYQGMPHFEEADASRFFGREQLTARVIGRLAQTRFLAVIGASGSGKSSLVRAGVIPALKSGQQLADGALPPSGSVHWLYRIVRPGGHPLDALAVALSPAPDRAATLRDQLEADPRSLAAAVGTLLAQEGHSHLLLVVDQFEEIFTRVKSSEKQKAFFDALMSVYNASDMQRVSILICLRSDFYSQVAQHDALREVVSQHQELIGAMRREDLLSAMLAPLHQNDWKIQEGLIKVILDDLGDEPGALPLLSHTLLETWKRRRGRTLTVSGYSQSGGVKGSIRETAENVFKQLTREQQSIAKMIFLRLAEISEDLDDPRIHSRRASFSELITSSANEADVRAVIDILANADARLVTTDTLEPDNREIVEVAHEALIREWPRLQEWLNRDRRGRIIHQQLTKDANNWLKLERDRGALYGGIKLSDTLKWAQVNKEGDAIAENKNMINALEKEFLEASAANETQEETQRAMLRDAIRGENGLLPFAVAWASVGLLLADGTFFWTQVTAFALVGLIRGFIKELLLSVCVIVALVFNRLVIESIPFVQRLPQEDSMSFWVRVLPIGFITLYIYQFIYGVQPIERLAKIGRWTGRLQDSVLSMIMGAFNGYLFSGTIMYYLYISNYVTLDDPIVNQIVPYMPPAILRGGGLYAALFMVAIFFVILFEDLFWSEDTRNKFLSKLRKQATMWFATAREVGKKYLQK